MLQSLFATSGVLSAQGYCIVASCRLQSTAEPSPWGSNKLLEAEIHLTKQQAEGLCLTIACG